MTEKLMNLNVDCHDAKMKIWYFTLNYKGRKILQWNKNQISFHFIPDQERRVYVYQSRTDESL